MRRPSWRIWEAHEGCSQGLRIGQIRECDRPLGTPPKGEGDVGNNEVVLAYEKKVPTEGGYVLMSAGTVMKMSAAEFTSAPKGKK